MALIGNGAQAKFQALAMKEVVGIDSIRLYDVDRRATDKTLHNLRDSSLHPVVCASAESAVEGAQIITRATADKQFTTILRENMVGLGVHVNAIGGDCPGKTELHRDILLRADAFVEYPPQTWIEGEIQQMDRSYPITELWRVVAGLAPGRRDAQEITLFDGVGFAIEDFLALQYVRECVGKTTFCEMLDMIADPDDPATSMACWNVRPSLVHLRRRHRRCSSHSETANGSRC